MSDPELNARVEFALSEARTSTNGWLRTRCPACITRTGKRDHKQSLGLRPDTGFFYCLRCGIRGRLRRHRNAITALTTARPSAVEPKPTDLGPPAGFEPIYEGDAATACWTAVARRYLEGRGVPASTWGAVRMGAARRGEAAGRIVVPLLETGGSKWLGWVGRIWRKREGVLPYRYPAGMPRGALLFNHDALLVETAEPCMIVEGVFDALPHWPRAVACLGKPSRGQLTALMAARRPIVVVLDGDAWREGQALARLLTFRGRSTKWLRLPPAVDPGDIAPDQMAGMIEEASAA